MISQRMCVACRSIREKGELLRTVKHGGAVETDFGFKIQGRGAYVCRSNECVKKARRSRLLEKSLSMRVPDEVYDLLESLVNNGEQ